MRLRKQNHRCGDETHSQEEDQSVDPGKNDVKKVQSFGASTTGLSVLKINKKNRDQYMTSLGKHVEDLRVGFDREMLADNDVRHRS